MSDLDLFTWADSRPPELASEPSKSAQVLAFPTSRHTAVEMLARRFARYDDKRAAFFLRQEVSKLLAKRLGKGVPKKIAVQDAVALEQTIRARMCLLRQQQGGAA